MNLATSAGAKMPVLEAVQKHLQDVKDYAQQKGDMAGMYGAARRDAGLKYEN